MHLRPWLWLTLLFVVPTTAVYPYSVVDTLPDSIEQDALKGPPSISNDKSQDGKDPATREARGAAPTLKMTRRALPVS